MIDCRDECSCVVVGLSWEHRAPSLRGVFFKKQNIPRQTNVCKHSEKTVNFHCSGTFLFFYKRVYCTCAPFPTSIMLYLSIILVDIDDYDTDDSVSP